MFLKDGTVVQSIFYLLEMSPCWDQSKIGLPAAEDEWRAGSNEGTDWDIWVKRNRELVQKWTKMVKKKVWQEVLEAEVKWANDDDWSAVEENLKVLQ